MPDQSQQVDTKAFLLRTDCEISLLTYWLASSKNLAVWLCHWNFSLVLNFNNIESVLQLSRFLKYKKHIFYLWHRDEFPHLFHIDLPGKFPTYNTS